MVNIVVKTLSLTAVYTKDSTLAFIKRGRIE